MRKFFIAFIFLLIPVFTNASVVINEVAWMGTANSTADEWIELYNNSNDTIDLNGWTLTILDKKDISLSGNISANSYYLIERTDDSTVPNITADLISSFGTGLSNSGAVLILKNNQGAEAQKIDASSGWTAGDNSTKQTMQWDGLSWITGDPTPRVANSNSTTVVESTMPSQAQTQTTQGVVWPVEPQIYADAGADKTAIAGADIVFTGGALGLDKKPMDGARYLWSFGDGASAEGKSVKHFYKYPGEYIAFLNVSNTEYSAGDSALVKIIPNQLKITEATSEFIKLKNDSSATLDITGWFIKSGGKLFKFPQTTLIKSGATLIIDSSISGIGASDGKAELLYPNGSQAVSFANQGVSSPPTPLPEGEGSPQGGVRQELVEHSVFNTSETADENQTASVASVVQNQKENKKTNVGGWLALASGVGVVSAGGLIFVRRKGLL